MKFSVFNYPFFLREMFFIPAPLILLPIHFLIRLEAGQAVVAHLANYVAAIVVAVVTDSDYNLIPTLRVLEGMVAATDGAADAVVFGLSTGIVGAVVPIDPALVLIDPAATADKADGTAGHTVKAEISLPFQ
jgi:hypothetical protein